MYEISVKLITKPNIDPVTLIGGLARLTQIKEEFELSSRERGLKILDFIAQAGHTSLLEHAYFGVVIHGASRVFLAQITRHRVASYMSQSQQYQDHDNFPYVIPESIMGDDLSCRVYDEFMKHAQEVYETLKARVGRDDARYVIPGGARNDLFVTMNARELILAAFPQRLCKRNTPESMYIMKLWLKALVDEGYGDLFKYAGPTCVTKGCCNEGRMACGNPYKNWEELIDVDTPNHERTEAPGPEAA